MQVAQLEKEKREMNERLRIIAKRIDHIERAYRKEERPLLAKDYEEQQQLDRQTFETVQLQRKEASKLAHKQDLETKGRLKRMLNDHNSWKQVLAEKKGDAYKKKADAAAKKIEQEKAKRKAAVLKAWEEEKARKEKEEAERRAREEEERREEEGMLSNVDLLFSLWLTCLSSTSCRGGTSTERRRRKSCSRGSGSQKERGRSCRSARSTGKRTSRSYGKGTPSTTARRGSRRTPAATSCGARKGKGGWGEEIVWFRTRTTKYTCC